MVDDTEDIREYFDEISKQLGLSCDYASSGEEALEVIRKKGPYDIYFVDWKMPGMDGLELTRYIKRELDEKAVVVLVTAAEWSSIEGEAKEAGVTKFIPKPLFSSSIADCINQCLGDENLTETTTDESFDNFGEYRIILAEDVEINREIVLSLLEPTNLTIDCAGNGNEALSLFSESPDKYDLIFMDVHMPEMDGFEATRRIRALDIPKAKFIPIVAMTANVFREDIEKCLASGMNDHVGKPLNMGVVFDKLRIYLPKRA
jgi:CheY-like chemotaxis protein